MKKNRGGFIGAHTLERVCHLFAGEPRIRGMIHALTKPVLEPSTEGRGEVQKNRTPTGRGVPVPKTLFSPGEISRRGEKHALRASPV
jgi:hypothetical protein